MSRPTVTRGGGARRRTGGGSHGSHLARVRGQAHRRHVDTTRRARDGIHSPHQAELRFLLVRGRCSVGPSAGDRWPHRRVRCSDLCNVSAAAFLMAGQRGAGAELRPRGRPDGRRRGFGGLAGLSALRGDGHNRGGLGRSGRSDTSQAVRGTNVPHGPRSVRELRRLRHRERSPCSGLAP